MLAIDLCKPSQVKRTIWPFLRPSEYKWLVLSVSLLLLSGNSKHLFFAFPSINDWYFPYPCSFEWQLQAPFSSAFESKIEINTLVFSYYELKNKRLGYIIKTKQTYLDWPHLGSSKEIQSAAVNKQMHDWNANIFHPYFARANRSVWKIET